MGTRALRRRHTGRLTSERGGSDRSGRAAAHQFAARVEGLVQFGEEVEDLVEARDPSRAAFPTTSSSSMAWRLASVAAQQTGLAVWVLVICPGP